ncbi:MAG TPA: hypothetical protein VLX92_25105 [Kofleriaceae bacterium]|nr:hypothetical protein [Kofleriaceae bacterium]
MGLLRRIVGFAPCAALACGGGAKSQSTVPVDILEGRTPPADAAAATPRPQLAALAPEAACTRFKALAAAQCSWTQRFPSEFTEARSCEVSLAKWFAPETADHEKLQQTVACWALDCDDATDCMVRVQRDAAPPPPRACGEEGTAPISVDAAAWSARRGGDARRFADVTTTVEQPVEVCGIDGEVDWMTRVTCNDGSNPYGSPAVANQSRDGWVGRGGRCNSILDRYTVRCPEAAYQVYVDRYVCPTR